MCIDAPESTTNSLPQVSTPLAFPLPTISKNSLYALFCSLILDHGVLLTTSASDPKNSFFAILAQVFKNKLCLGRKGWTVMEVPNGWCEVLRGPWPVISRGQHQHARRAQQRRSPHASTSASLARSRNRSSPF